MTSTAATALPDPTVDDTLAPAKGHSKLILAGGCFWGVQAVFQHVKGVKEVTSGYSGGTVKNPSYEMVETGRTGHAESVEIVYDPSKITLGQLLKIFFSVATDPTELNRQGPTSARNTAPSSSSTLRSRRPRRARPRSGSRRAASSRGRS